jgi:hypothetical protein
VAEHVSGKPPEKRRLPNTRVPDEVTLNSQSQSLVAVALTVCAAQR